LKKVSENRKIRILNAMVIIAVKYGSKWLKQLNDMQDVPTWCLEKILFFRRNSGINNYNINK
jgi:hypothetical protein